MAYFIDSSGPFGPSGACLMLSLVAAHLHEAGLDLAAKTCSHEATMVLQPTWIREPLKSVCAADMSKAVTSDVGIARQADFMTGYGSAITVLLLKAALLPDDTVGGVHRHH